ncbi:hypothetical protein VC83_08883 [Pseudogymnoascus destructans]|uniref:Pectate lyase n=1 Tax=Pseudogymnoascus destructans TaxID=655981 RepID=A0A176ZZN4_9PEZI|nr:uncharacterized protein VC83_08883 [Pseudogymnoascus destructans]OAF54790.1 hypothetical protein VC83_08883 [Pseudogymnoascus destructans]
MVNLAKLASLAALVPAALACNAYTGGLPTATSTKTNSKAMPTPFSSSARALAGINSNYGDTATIKNSCFDTAHSCQMFTGCNNGCELAKAGYCSRKGRLDVCEARKNGDEDES